MHKHRGGVKEQGVALITVLLITAILVGLTTQILSSHNLVINQHQNTFEGGQALHYALGAEELARQVLFDDAVNSGPGVDHLEEFWAQSVLPFDLDGIGLMQAYIIDLNRCFNVNRLENDPDRVNYKRLQSLIGQLGLSPGLADLIKDWIDADQIVTGFGAEDSAYLIKTPRYFAANQVIIDVSELAMLEGVDPVEVQMLAQHICLTPDPASKINVNTADAITLSVLDAGISMETAEAVVAQPRNYLTVADFISANPDFTAVQSELSVVSDHFLLVAQAQLNSSRVSLTSLLRRDLVSNQLTLLQRDFGKRFVVPN